ncbi:MAG: hypothetical protein OEM90_21375, partial [Desulfobacteraceae bacterium]|nr:hypothetical protein [Desulfobacteraceae bacterium]
IGGPVTGLTAKSMEGCGWMISDWKKISQSLSDLIRKFDDVLFILFNRPLVPYSGASLETQRPQS